jgi:hypothetical protein
MPHLCVSLHPAVRAAVAALCCLLLTCSAASAAPSALTAQSVELGVRLAWADGQGPVSIERRSLGTADWGSAAINVRSSSWVDDLAAEGTDYEYRLVDAAGQASEPVTGRAGAIAGADGAVVTASRMQTITRQARCILFPSQCGGGDASTIRQGRGVLHAAGPSVGGRDRGVAIRIRE